MVMDIYQFIEKYGLEAHQFTTRYYIVGRGPREVSALLGAQTLVHAGCGWAAWSGYANSDDGYVHTWISHDRRIVTDRSGCIVEDTRKEIEDVAQ